MFKPPLRDREDREVEDRGDKQLPACWFAVSAVPAMFGGAAGLAGLDGADGGSPAFRLSLELPVSIRSGQQGGAVR